MWSSLKNQLLITSIGALALLLLGVWFVTRGFVNLAITMMVFTCIYIIALNLWFWYFVTDPLAELTRFSRHIAEGSYGVKLETSGSDEIGKLTAEINNMSEKVAITEKSRTDFISQVSHELRTPLTAIMGWSETIAFDPAVQGDSLRGINIISK